MKLLFALCFAALAVAQTKVKPTQLEVKPAMQLSLAVVDQRGTLNTAIVGNGLNISKTSDGTYYLSCMYASGSIPARTSVKFEGQIGVLSGMPRYLDVYRNGLLMSPEDGDYSIQQVDNKTTITFSDLQKLDPTDIVRIVYWN